MDRTPKISYKEIHNKPIKEQFMSNYFIEKVHYDYIIHFFIENSLK